MRDEGDPLSAIFPGEMCRKKSYKPSLDFEKEGAVLEAIPVVTHVVPMEHEMSVFRGGHKMVPSLVIGVGIWENLYHDPIGPKYPAWTKIR